MNRYDIEITYFAETKDLNRLAKMYNKTKEDMAGLQLYGILTLLLSVMVQAVVLKFFYSLKGAYKSAFEFCALKKVKKSVDGQIK